MKVVFEACPFCGSKDIMSALVPGMKWTVGCNNCGVRTKYHDSLLEAVTTWDRRPEPEQVTDGGQEDTDAGDGIRKVDEIMAGMYPDLAVDSLDGKDLPCGF